MTARRAARQDRDVAHPGGGAGGDDRHGVPRADHARTAVEATRTGEVEHLLNWAPVKAGETYLIPAHTVHAIGAGIVLCEIQQNSDVTYRLWDYGRPREIHVEKAVPICDLGVHPGASRGVRVSDTREELVRDRHFIAELVRLGAGATETPEPHVCQLWIAIEGSGSIGSQAYGRGDVWLLPETGAQPEVQAGEPSRFLRTWVP
jgi:mannose-6-phosphate isomerase